MSGLDDLGYDLHDYVRELTQTHAHREPYTVRHSGTTWTQHHKVRVPSLIDQLCDATPGGAGEKVLGGGGARPMPPAHLEALDVLVDIDKAASRWVRDLGRDDPIDTVDARGFTVRGSGAKACLLILGTLYRGFGPDDSAAAKQLTSDVRRWWTWARIASGWDSSAWRPDNTCPVCAVRGALRVRLSAGSGFCVECRATWDPNTIGLLAEHIRGENREDEADEVAS